MILRFLSNTKIEAFFIMKKFILLPSLEKDICNYYLLPNSICETAKHFNLSRTVIKKVLLKHNIKVRPHKIVLTKETEAEVIRFYLRPSSLNKTAKVFKLDRKIVERILYKNNIPLHDMSKRKFTLEREAELIDFYRSPHSLKETSKKFNIHTSIIKRILVKHSIPLHSKKMIFDLRLQKFKDTNINKYGIDYPLRLSEIKEKGIQTCLKKYGKEHYNQTQEFKDRARKTNLEKYGCENPFQNTEIKEKRKKAIYTKYGLFHSPSGRYIYNNINFDSFPELCFYLYHIKNNIQIKREPAEFEYIYNNKKYYYTPDFEVNGQLYEIKGNQFLAEDKTWCNPYDHKQDEQFKEKYYCAVKNHIIILYNKDYQKYIDWFYRHGYKNEDFLKKKD